MKVGFLLTPLIFQLPMGSGSCSRAHGRRIGGDHVALGVEAVTEPSESSTTTFAALPAGAAVCTFGTWMVSPARSKRLPGFRRCRSFGLAWNFSPSASSADV